MGTNQAAIPWPPPADVYWECPGCGPAAYELLRDYEPRGNNETSGHHDSQAAVRIVRCLSCSAEHVTSFSPDGQVRITEAASPTSQGFYEYSALDEVTGSWRHMVSDEIRY